MTTTRRPIRRWRWVTREMGTYLLRIYPGPVKPKNVDGNYDPMGRDYALLPDSEFRAMTGLNIKPGSCQRVLFGKARVLRAPARKGNR